MASGRSQSSNRAIIGVGLLLVSLTSIASVVIAGLCLPALATAVSSPGATPGGSIELRPTDPLRIAVQNSAGAWGGWMRVSYDATCASANHEWYVFWQTTDEFGYPAGSPHDGNVKVVGKTSASGTIDTFVLLDRNRGLNVESFRARLWIACNGRAIGIGTANLTLAKGSLAPTPTLSVRFTITDLQDRPVGAVRVGQQLSVRVSVTANGENLTNVILAPGVAVLDGNAAVTASPPGLPSFPSLSDGLSQSVSYTVTGLSRGQATLVASANADTSAGSVADGSATATLHVR